MRVVLILLLLLPAVIVNAQNFTNKGKEFWVGYGHNQFFNPAVGKNQEMVIYLSAEQPATVTVSISGTSWTRTYTIPANTVIVSDIIPRTGPDDCRLTGEGLFSKAVHIESNVDIVAYAHVYGNWSSGATMLLPVVTYGYTYYSLNTEQYFMEDCYSWFYVVASENSTRVRITTSGPTIGGLQKNVPVEIDLNKGQIYNVMGVTNTGGRGTDMSGSKIVSIVGSDGKCHPISVFSGSSRTMIGCGMPGFGAGGDFMMQQIFPFNAWGTRYLAALASAHTGAADLTMNKFRVYVSDPTTLVKNNGVNVTGLTNGIYYEFSTNVSPYITATKPVMVAQILPSSNSCGTSDSTDPEMIFITPMEQSINRVSFYNTDKESITHNYLTLVIPQTGLTSLLIDGSNLFDYTYPHPGLPGYEVVVKELPKTPGQHNVSSDVGFTAITYGMGFAETYGYNAGCYINNLLLIPEIQNPATNVPLTNICTKTPFNFFAKSLYQLRAITWHFSEVPGAKPATDVTVNNPVPIGTELINGKTYYIYQCPQPVSIAQTGLYNVPVTITAPQIDNCSNSEKILLNVQVTPGPQAEFTTVPVCAGDTALFTGSSPTPGVDGYKWTFPDGTTDAATQTKKAFATGGNYSVNFQVSRSLDACMGDTTKIITIHYKPDAAFTSPAVVCMPNGEAAFTNQSTITGNTPQSLQNSWEFGDGGVSTVFTPTHAYATRGSYPIRLIVESQQGCRDTASLVFARFADAPIAKFGATDSAFCQGKAIVFSDSSIYTNGATGRTWQWQFGDGSNGAGAQPSKMYQQPGTYQVSMTVTSDEGCTSNAAVKTIDVYEVPKVDAGPDLITDAGRAVQLQGSVSTVHGSIAWTPAMYLSNPGILTPLASPPNTQQYYLTATGDHNCSSIDSVLVKVYKELKIPNAFTPNHDGHNDVWNIPGLADYKNASVQIFNRWGQIIYRSTGYSRPWDGSFNGNALPTGSYYYVIHPKENGYGALTGFVLLIR